MTKTPLMIYKYKTISLYKISMKGIIPIHPKRSDNDDFIDLYTS